MENNVPIGEAMTLLDPALADVKLSDLGGGELLLEIVVPAASRSMWASVLQAVYVVNGRPFIYLSIPVDQQALDISLGIKTRTISSQRSTDANLAEARRKAHASGFVEMTPLRLAREYFHSMSESTLDSGEARIAFVIPEAFRDIWLTVLQGIRVENGTPFLIVPAAPEDGAHITGGPSEE